MQLSKSDRLVTGLEKDNFTLLEQNALQDIKYFSSEDAPISLGVIFDLSGSMGNKIQKSRDAIIESGMEDGLQDALGLLLAQVDERIERLANHDRRLVGHAARQPILPPESCRSQYACD